jgi:hypothetical protein
MGNILTVSGYDDEKPKRVKIMEVITARLSEGLDVAGKMRLELLVGQLIIITERRLGEDSASIVEQVKASREYQEFDLNFEIEDSAILKLVEEVKEKYGPQ